MNYVSINFILFYCIVFSYYYFYAATCEKQIATLILASLGFYAWENPFLLCVFVATWLVSSITSFYVSGCNSLNRAKGYAILGVIFNLSLLSLFKYKSLWPSSVAEAYQSPETLGEWLVIAPLPIGISFYIIHCFIKLFNNSFLLAHIGNFI